MHKLNSRVILAVLAAAALVGACGGDDDGDSVSAPPSSGTEVPASAQASNAGLVDYVNMLIGMSSDTSEPVVIGNAVLPTSDTTE